MQTQPLERASSEAKKAEEAQISIYCRVYYGTTRLDPPETPISTSASLSEYQA